MRMKRCTPSNGVVRHGPPRPSPERRWHLALRADSGYLRFPGFQGLPRQLVLRRRGERFGPRTCTQEVRFRSLRAPGLSVLACRASVAPGGASVAMDSPCDPHAQSMRERPQIERWLPAVVTTIYESSAGVVRRSARVTRRATDPMLRRWMSASPMGFAAAARLRQFRARAKLVRCPTPHWSAGFPPLLHPRASPWRS